MWLIIVLSQYFFSTLLIWREVMVLEGAYVTNQRNNLENVAHEMDSLLLFNIDRMVFFATGCSRRWKRRWILRFCVMQNRNT
jgi:hypothetical protein